MPPDLRKRVWRCWPVFADRDLSENPFPYLVLDATYCKARIGGGKGGQGSRVASQAVVIATGVSADGRRKVLGFAVGDSEDGAGWTGFLRSLKARGLSGTKLVISDAHTGLKQAIGAVMIEAAWQRCRVHFMRNVLAQVPEVETMLREAAGDLPAFADLPPARWKKIWSTNPLERVNKEIKRRTNVVGVFPNPAALLHLAGCVLIETHDECKSPAAATYPRNR